MKHGIIGERSTFAIEWQITSLQSRIPYGHCVIWIEDNLLGDREDEVFLISVFNSLQRLLSARDRIPAIPNELPESGEELLHLAEMSNNHFLPIEGFDEFVKLVFRDADRLIILWSLHPKLLLRAEHQSYPSQVIRAAVPIEVAAQVVDEFGGAVTDL
jgi:hypothetical protein